MDVCAFAMPEVPPAQNASSADALSTAEIKSTPDGADISVDDAFVGNAPATLKLSAGKHTIKVTRAGFKDWSRDITGWIRRAFDGQPGEIELSTSTTVL